MTTLLQSLQTLRLEILRRQFEGHKVSPNSSLMRSYKALMPTVLSAFTQAMLVGLMLGDVSLKGNKTLTGASIQMEGGDKHMAYAFHVGHMLYPYCIGLPRRQVRINAAGHTVVSWCFQTVTHPAFLFLHDLFIISSAKHVVSDLLIDAITPVSLAYWFMDDGGRQDKTGYGLQIHTQGFSEQEVLALCAILTSKFNLKCGMKHNKGLPIIVISGDSYLDFFALVNPYIIEEMRFKLPTGGRSTGSPYDPSKF